MAYLDYTGLSTFLNKIKELLSGKQDSLTFDSTPTSGSSNPVTSGGVYTALDSKANLASPTFTGTPKAPTASASTNNTQIATTAFVKTAVGNYVPTSAKGAANGVCPLDANSKIDSQYLPSYVDDVVEAYIRSGQTALSSAWLATGSASGTVITPEAGKIYVLMNSDSTYSENTEFRWGSSAYVKINDGGISEMTTSEMDTATSNWS